MLDLGFSNLPTKPNPVLLKIMLQHDALSKMLSFVTGAVNEAENETKKEWDAQLQQLSPDQLKEEQDLFYKMDGQLEDYFNVEHYFYQSAFLMVYSYFDSMMQLMMLVHTKENRNWSKTPSGKFSGNPLSTNFGIKLDKKGKEDFYYLYKTIRHLRNMTVHNYNGVPSNAQIKTAKEESYRKIGFSFVEYRYPIETNKGNLYYYFYTKEYVQMVLDRVYQVLCAIAEKLGLK